MIKLILASASPRRRQLLTDAGLRFECIESGLDELRNANEPGRDYTLRMAEAKALAVSKLAPTALILGADTIVESEGEILEKPRDADDACRMLRMLSDRTHRVVTGFALARAGEIVDCAAIESLVTFRVLTDEEIEAYIDSGEPFDKAGAYGIQGIGGEFISGVVGPRDNVMGLPVESVLAALSRAGFDSHSQAG